ncbi:MAG: hypothetical protein HOJ96_03180, partial [Campylobacteraceae bacterium]|nr:hypothetical protein [Campylobacteraceae bacterium]
LALNNEFSRINFEYTLDVEDEILSIKSNEDLYIVKQAVDKIETPDELKIKLI